MPDERLMQYIRTNLSKGFSLKEIREGMLKYGYTDREIDRLFKTIAEEKLMHLEPLPESNRINGGFYFLILLGLASLSLAAAFPIVIFSGFGRLGEIVTLLITIVLGMVLGFAINWGIGLFNESKTLKTLTGIFAPLLAVSAIIAVFFGKSLIIKLALANGPNPIHETIGSSHSPVLLGLIFYIAANSFIVASLIKAKKEKHLLWYPLAGAAYTGLWILVTWLVKGFIMTVVLKPTV